MTNEVKLSGRVYRAEQRTTSQGKQVTRFGLSIWCGKDNDGKSKYNFVNCTYWGDHIENGTDIEISGYLAFDEWEKDGKKSVRPFIMVNELNKRAQESKTPPLGASGGWDNEFSF